MEVFYMRADGVRVRGFAYMDRRTIPPVWRVGDGTPLHEVKQISKVEWLLGHEGPEWEASARAMIR
jgi:hypothetical protein